MPCILKYCFFFYSFLILCTTVKSQDKNLVGIGFSFHNSAISNLTVNNYLQEETSVGYGSPTNFNTPQYSYSIKYGRVISPSVIFFTGIEKIGMGHKFEITLLEFHDNYNSPPTTPTTTFSETNHKLELQLNYLKIPFTLYWKLMRDKPLGMFTSFGIDLGILTSATFSYDGVPSDYKEKLNTKDINYKFKLGVRYDTDKYNINLSLGFGNGFSDVEKKEKIGATVQNPSQNLLIGSFLSLNRKF